MINRAEQEWPEGTAREIRVERRSPYQGVPQWGVTGQAEITPSRKTAEKWAALENAARNR